MSLYSWQRFSFVSSHSPAACHIKFHCCDILSGQKSKKKCFHGLLPMLRRLEIVCFADRGAVTLWLLSTLLICMFADASVGSSYTVRLAHALLC